MSFTARASSADKRFYGVAVAIVTAVNDDKEQEGRVKVRFPWLDDSMETEWCRVAQIYAGNGYGAFFIPEVDDEVLVAFDHGDLHLPIILAGLYNGQDKPPSHRAANRDQKLIRTKGRHELLFDDSGGQERVRIKTSAGHSVDLDDAGKKVTIRTASGETVTLEAGSVKLSATSVTLDAASVALGGSAAAHALVLGDLLLGMFNSHTHICTAPGLPSAPPLPLLTPAVLSTTSKTS